MESTIADKDKLLLDLLEERDCKKKQLKEDYKKIKINVKENPYLQTAIKEYEKYFEVEKQQIKALKMLLKHVKQNGMNEDIKHIQKKINHLEQDS